MSREKKSKATPRRPAKAATPARAATVKYIPAGSQAKPRGIGKPFLKGFDPRRNLNGRPKSHDELRELIREIGAQRVPEAHGLSYLQFMILAMFASPQARDHQNLFEHGFGKVKDVIDADLNVVLEDASRLSDDERARRVAQILERGGPRPARSPARRRTRRRGA